MKGKSIFTASHICVNRTLVTEASKEEVMERARVESAANPTELYYVFEGRTAELFAIYVGGEKYEPIKRTRRLPKRI